jgi:hypothetical protein
MKLLLLSAILIYVPITAMNNSGSEKPRYSYSRWSKDGQEFLTTTKTENGKKTETIRKLSDKERVKFYHRSSFHSSLKYYPPMEEFEKRYLKDMVYNKDICPKAKSHKNMPESKKTPLITSVDRSSPTRGSFLETNKKYADGSAEEEIQYPDGESFITRKDNFGHTLTKTCRDGKIITLDISYLGDENKPDKVAHIDTKIPAIKSFAAENTNVPSKKKENIVLNAKLHAWIQKPTDEYDHNRSRQEIDEPIRSIDNSVRKSGEYYSRTICDSMEKYSQLRKPIEMEKKIVLLNSGGFNREQLLEQMDKVTDKIEILTDEYAREFIRMRGDIPEDEIENHLEEVKQIIKDEWFKNYSHLIHTSSAI